jgi:phosphocarrier protein HPr
MDFVRRSVLVVNEAGLHARPCHAIVSLALTFEAELRIACAGQEVSGRSILELMTLAAAKGQELELKASGKDAEALLTAVQALVAAGFDED